MLRKRSRGTTSKQALMADFSPLPSPTDKYRKPSASLFISPRLFTSFTHKSFSEIESAMSPTSILDSKPFSGLRNPFWSETNMPRNPEPEIKRHWDNLDSKGIGLAIVDALIEEKTDSKPSKPESRMVLFGSHLKIQIPPPPSSVLSPAESPKSPADFGTKTRSSQLGSSSSGLSQSPAKKSAFGSSNSGMETPNSSRVFTGCLSAIEMELSEDYTCVISHGPNPRTTHIFEDCIVESCCGGAGFADSRKEIGIFTDRPSSFPSESFLSICYSCKKNLGQGKDIYMYRGEKAFCSSECRQQQMLLEEGMDKLEPDDYYGICS
ncbi:FCS-Like Zinc finger 8 [Corylus avellana]|uniref:FCS-Like Zinc finger 8 n=1 Tax=Corylus avellana TaxID=13451 RepID=UPI001E1FF435|nr:FCS-Like Zinc finger 8 [Corylus avellana]